MKKTAIVILCVTAAVTASCRPEQTTRRESGSATSGMATGAMTSVPLSAMTRPAPMDISLPPDDPAGKARRPPPTRPERPGVLKAALADLDWIMVRQRQVAKLWLSLHTLDDARKHRAALIKGTLDVLQLTISSMRKAVTLSTSGFAKFLRKQKAQGTQTRQMGVAIKAKQQELMALPGGEAFFGSLKKTATEKVQKHSKTLMLLGKQLLARQNELKR